MGLALLERALAEPAPPRLRPGLLLAAGRTARILARPDAKRYLGKAHVEATDPVLRSDAAAELAQAIFHARPQEAVDVLRRALAALPHDEREQAGRLRLELLTIETPGMLRPPSEIERDIRELHAGAPDGSPARLGAACLLVWHQQMWEHRLHAAAIGALARELSDVRPLIDAYGADFIPLTWAASVLGEWDRLDLAQAVFAAVLDAAQRTGNAFAFTLAASSRIHSAWCGNFSDTEADARAALHTAALTGSWTGRRGAVMALVWALTGRVRGDRRHPRRPWLEHDAGSSPPVDGNLLLARSILRRCEARYAEAREDAVRAIEIVRPTNPLNRINVWAPRRSPPVGSASARWSLPSGRSPPPAPRISTASSASRCTRPVWRNAGSARSSC